MSSKWAKKGLLHSFGWPSYPAPLLGLPGHCWPVNPIKLPTKKKVGGPFPLQKLRGRFKKCFKSSCSRSIQLGKILSQSVSSLHTQFGGNKFRNHVLYPIPLIALKMSNKKGAVVDTVFCPPSILHARPWKIQKYNFSPWGHENI